MAASRSDRDMFRRLDIKLIHYFSDVAAPSVRAGSSKGAEKSEQAETDFDAHAHRNGSPVAQSRFEFPSPHCFQGLFVEPEA